MNGQTSYISGSLGPLQLVCIQWNSYTSGSETITKEGSKVSTARGSQHLLQDNFFKREREREKKKETWSEVKQSGGWVGGDGSGGTWEEEWEWI